MRVGMGRSWRRSSIYHFHLISPIGPCRLRRGRLWRRGVAPVVCRLCPCMRGRCGCAPALGRGHVMDGSRRMERGLRRRWRARRRLRVVGWSTVSLSPRVASAHSVHTQTIICCSRRLSPFARGHRRTPSTASTGRYRLAPSARRRNTPAVMVRWFVRGRDRLPPDFTGFCCTIAPVIVVIISMIIFRMS